ncbi:hypothetical protein AB0N14_17650 [Streptomyces sp. NPDC051104]|uniref:hypothetical protein n=1 Tax=Streptomyces sp. NPDC051104 TaxID=3155044 RepID=UPI003422C4A4
MGARDFLRSLRPGDDRALAQELRQKKQAAGRRRADEQTAAVQAISDRDRRRTPAEVAASKERGRRSKRGPFEPPAPGVNP